MRASITNRSLRKVAPSDNQDWFRVENKKKPQSGKTTTEIFIYDEIGFWGSTAKDFVAKLDEIDSEQIDLHINSPGGAVFDGLAIYNALLRHDAEIVVYVDALAASAASFIAQAGDKIYMTLGSTMMIHDGAGLVWGTAADMQKMTDILNKLSNNIASIYSASAGGTVEEWRALMVEEMWYNAEEAVEAKLAQEVLDYREDDAENDASNKWNLSVFNYAGRSNAPSPALVRQRVSNRLKETAVKPGEKKNQGGDGGEGSGTEGTPPVTPDQPAQGHPASPDTDPEAPTTGEPEGGNKDNKGGTGPAVPPTPSHNPTNQAGQVTFKVNGAVVSDLSRVQAHIDSLETFRTETLENARKSFVAQLASDNKINAADIKELEEFALELSPTQYERWTKTWNRQSAQPHLGGQHGPGPGNADPQGSANKAQHLEDLKGIVAQHKMGGMKHDQIKATGSYKELMTLDPNFEL